MQKSSDIASSLSALMKVEQLQGVTQQFSQELMKVTILDLVKIKQTSERFFVLFLFRWVLWMK